MRRWIWAAAGLGLLVVLLLVRERALQTVQGRRTVEGVVEEVGPVVRPSLARLFEEAGCDYPPGAVALVALKDEKTLEIWATDRSPAWRPVTRYPIRGASGGPGPKLREGDGQVPEGIYRIAGLNPNSAFHLSMKLDYPNAFDRERGRADGRTRLGGDIFIHGGSASIGCLAMGDEAIEELFTLVHDTGRDRVTVTIAPTDLRTRRPPSAGPAWTDELYGTIRENLMRLRTPAPPAPPPR